MNIKYSDYAITYWKDLPNWSPCKNCGTICNTPYCSKDCFKSGLSNQFKGRVLAPFTDEHKRKISEASVKRLSDKTKHPMYGKKHTKESIDKNSQTHKEIFSDKTKHPMYGKLHSDETKKLMSESKIEYYETHDAPFKGKTHTSETIRKIFENKPMNKLEKRVADWLDSHNIDYIFQFFISENGVCKSYDFKLKNSNIILEVHGDYWHGGSGVKKHVFNVETNINNDEIKRTLAEQRGYEVRVVWEHQLNDDMDILNSILTF